jgi:hypothetical protein
MSELPLRQAEILRYLGYRRKMTLTAETSALIDDVIAETLAVAKPRFTWRISPLEECATGVLVPDVALNLPGKSIQAHLAGATQVALLAATLGTEVERFIRRYEITDMARAQIMDAVCVEYIETICDLAQVVLAAELPMGVTQNRRFSPGYGDLPLAVQPDFLAALDAPRKLGLALTDTMLMIPRKSVTAVIGLFTADKLARPRFTPRCDLQKNMAQENWRIL